MPKEFKPIDITITFKSQEMFDAFSTIFNFAPNNDWIGKIVNPDSREDFPLWRMLEQSGANLNKYFSSYQAMIATWAKERHSW